MVKTFAHRKLGEVGSSLEELWFEIGGSCHLRCDYCFAQSGGIDRDSNNLALEEITRFLDEFRNIGGQAIGIVGAGEPFHARNIRDTFGVLEQMKGTGIKTTIFTTADLLTDRVIGRLDQYPDITLLVKYNSANSEVQDRLVHSQGYTERRDEAMKKLIARGYNDGSRLGIVTSIMTENADEMPDLLRFARRNNLIFDADTLIPIGRGGTCHLQTIDDKTKAVLKELQRVDKEEFHNEWEITGSYVASPPCTRFSKHLYIDKTGKVHPCVGSPAVELGDIKQQTLAEIWNNPLMKIIREHNYSGKCTTCKNYEEHKCYSCLGRATEGLTTESLNRDGVVTTGCFNYRGK
jgi:MoaA/NifB/PqqE/SkfB family radical SAM enzyme